jgi:chromosome segregation ATPase
MSASQSILPPLTASDPTSLPLKRDIQRLYPRIQSLERDVQFVKKQIPSHVGKLLLQLRCDVAHLRSRSAAFCGESDNAATLAAQLADLESRMLKELEVSLSESSLAVEQRLVEIEGGMISEGRKSNNSEIIDRLRRIDHSMKNRFKQSQNRLLRLENSIAKLLAGQFGKDREEPMEALGGEVSAQRQKLCELENRIGELGREVAAAAARPEVVLARVESEEPTVLDVSTPIESVQKDMESMRAAFNQSLEQLQQKSQVFEQRAQEAAHMAQKLSAMAQSLEQRVGDAEDASQALLAHVGDLSQQMKVSNSEQQSIRTLASQIRAAHEAMKAQIVAVQSRLKKCQMALPLLTVDPT